MDVVKADDDEAFGRNVNNIVSDSLGDCRQAEKLNASYIKCVSRWVGELVEAPVNFRENIFAFDCCEGNVTLKKSSLHHQTYFQ